ncbi:MAG TPA: hypothetical protein VH678_33580 [Xanthobacteraceae bacterium]
MKNTDVPPEALSDTQPASSASVEETPNVAAESSRRESADASASGQLPRRIGWKALIAGGLSGAVVAAGLMVAGFLIIRDTDLKELGARVARVEAQLREARSGDRGVVESLANRVGKLEGAIAQLGSTPVDTSPADRSSALNSDFKALSARVDGLAQRTESAASAASEVRRRSDANAAGLAELTNKMAAAADAVGREKLAGEVRSLADRVGAVETKLGSASDASGRLAVAAMALGSAVERGQPFVPELAAVKSLGASSDLLKPLEPFAKSGIPNQATLSHELLGLIPSLRAVQPVHGNFLTRMQENAQKLVRIRSEDTRGGKNVSAVLDRTEIKAANADLAGALAELEQLPPAVRAPADAWIEKAKARSAAVSSSQRLLTAALAGLSK